MTKGSDVEFSRVYRVADIPESGLALVLEADEAERAALARRFGVEALPSLKADVTLTPWRKVGLRLQGTFVAEVVQICVVTLAPIRTRLSETVERRYLPGDRLTSPQAGAEVVVDPEEVEEEPDVLDERIDVGEVVAESVALAIDPYPRKEGAAFGSDAGEGRSARGDDDLDNASEKMDSPFNILKKLKTDG